MKKRYILQHVMALIFTRSPHKLFNYKQISKQIGIVKPEEMLQVVEILYDLADENFITEINRGRYRYNDKGIILSGRFIRRRNGNNYFLPDDSTPRIAVGLHCSFRALDGDLVKIRLLTKRTGPSPEGEVIEILHRKEQRLTGTLCITKGLAFLITESKTLENNVFIRSNRLHGGRDGDKVLVRIISWNEDQDNPSGEILEVLGKAGEIQAEMKAILLEYGLPYQYPPHIAKRVDRISSAISENEIINRRDFRGIKTFTIDPAEAKDFDDALSARRLDNGNWEVGVHIADVTYYVKPGSAIDREAASRGMSIYMPNQTVPMLPERLCNQICSLQPDADKLCFSVIFELDNRARISNMDVCRTVIRSNRRFSYEEVQCILEIGNGDYKDEIIALNQMARLLREKRFEQGAVCFNHGQARLDSHKLIEEFMLLANQSVAKLVTYMPKEGKRKRPFIYRVHSSPKKEKLDKLCDLIYYYLPEINKKQLKDSRNLNHLLENITDDSLRGALELLSIRHMHKAKYSTCNTGHYGLALDCYSHFTSPIRRYPDMLVHRLLAHYLAGGAYVRRAKYEAACRHCSEKEVIIASAERDSVNYMQIEHMKGKEGEVFPGIVVNVKSWGLYVELIDLKCGGLIPVRSLGDEYFDYNEEQLNLTGRRTKRIFVLGDLVTVRLEQIDQVQKELYFSLIGVRFQKES